MEDVLDVEPFSSTQLDEIFRIIQRLLFKQLRGVTVVRNQ